MALRILGLQHLPPMAFPSRAPYSLQIANRPAGRRITEPYCNNTLLQGGDSCVSTEKVSCLESSLNWPEPFSAETAAPVSRSLSRCGRVVVGFLAATAIEAAIFPLPPPVLADFLSYDHADMHGADLSGRDLKGAVFAACDCRLINLQGANLDSSTVTFAGFQGANLQDTSWVQSLADRVVFRDANMRNANFSNAILSGSQFDGADITGADFSDAILDNYQRLKLCKKAEGTNSFTGVDTRESLFC